jgi:hypothetical protein
MAQLQRAFNGAESSHARDTGSNPLGGDTEEIKSTPIMVRISRIGPGQIGLT